METGTGYACLLAPTMSVLSVYFEKRISLANGVASAGGSIGQLPWSVFLTYLLKTYNLQGMLVIYGGCFLHLLIGAALMRPRSFYIGRSGQLKYPAVMEMQNLGNPGSGVSCEESLLDKQVDVRGTSPGSQPNEDVFGLKNEIEETVFVENIKNFKVDSGTAHAGKAKIDTSADVQTELEIRKDTQQRSRLDFVCHWDCGFGGPLLGRLVWRSKCDQASQLDLVLLRRVWNGDHLGRDLFVFSSVSHHRDDGRYLRWSISCSLHGGTQRLRRTSQVSHCIWPGCGVAGCFEHTRTLHFGSVPGYHAARMQPLQLWAHMKNFLGR